MLGGHSRALVRINSETTLPAFCRDFVDINRPTRVRCSTTTGFAAHRSRLKWLLPTATSALVSMRCVGFGLLTSQRVENRFAHGRSKLDRSRNCQRNMRIVPTHAGLFLSAGHALVTTTLQIAWLAPTRFSRRENLDRKLSSIAGVPMRNLRHALKIRLHISASSV